MSTRRVSRAGVAATIAAAVAIIAGLLTLDSPSLARERKLDRRRIEDLSRMSNLIDAYWMMHSALPPTLDTLAVLRLTDRVPVDPKNRSPYTYHVSGERSYRLCATFAQPSDSNASPGDEDGDIVYVTGTIGGPMGRQPHSWRHGAGESCFDLTAPSKDAK